MQRDVAGSGAVTRSQARASSGAASARLTTGSSGARAAIGTPLGTFADAVGAHQWEERPGTLPLAAGLPLRPGGDGGEPGTSDDVTIAQFWARPQPGSHAGARERLGGD